MANKQMMLRLPTELINNYRTIARQWGVTHNQVMKMALYMYIIDAKKRDSLRKSNAVGGRPRLYKGKWDKKVHSA